MQNNLILVLSITLIILNIASVFGVIFTARRIRDIKPTNTT